MADVNRRTRRLNERFDAAIDRQDDDTAAMLNRELHRNDDLLAKLQGTYAPERHEHDLRVSTAENRQRLLAAVWKRPCSFM